MLTVLLVCQVLDAQGLVSDEYPGHGIVIALLVSQLAELGRRARRQTRLSRLLRAVMANIFEALVHIVCEVDKAWDEIPEF